MTEQTALADKIERADGPSRALDCLAAVASGKFRKDVNERGPCYVRQNDDGTESWPGYGGAQLVPAYTSSIDAAMTLAPEGWRVDELKEGQNGDFWCRLRPRDYDAYFKRDPNGPLYITCGSKSFALALTAAALRAREASQ